VHQVPRQMSAFANVATDEDLSAPAAQCSRIVALVVIVMDGQRLTAASLGLHVASARNVLGPAHVSDQRAEDRTRDNALGS
jgi:hypothetical protein